VIRLGRSFWWFIVLLGVVVLITRLPGLGNDPIYGRLLIVFLFVLLVSFVWSFFSLVGMDLRRTTRTRRKQVGEIFNESFEIVNRSFLPKLWLKVSDQAQLPGASGSRVISWLGAWQTRTYVAYSMLMDRGWFRLGPSQIETGDIFGLFLFKKTFESTSRLLVIPYTVEIQNFPAPFGILPGGRALRQKTLEVTPYAAGVREYVPGDPLKRIHWPTSARKQKLIVKEFEKDPLAEVWIFLDACAGVHYSQEREEPSRLDAFLWVKQNRKFSLPPSTEEYAISIAASIGKYYLRQKREVGLVAAGQAFTLLPAERGERQLGKLLETLAVLKAEGNMPLWGVISSQLTHLARGSTIVLVTPSTDEQILTLVMELIQRGLMPVVVLIDQASFGGSTSSEELNEKLIRQGILTFVVHDGDNLRDVLENPGMSVDRGIVFRRS
jgi:uncharacterized protein (DUF58 family)